MKLQPLLAATLLFLSACASPTRTARMATPGEATLKVMTYNVNYGLAGDAETLAAIARRPVDIVVLQETNEAWEMSIRAELSTAYPHMQFFECCGAGGLAILSREPITQVEYLEAIDWFPAMRVVVDSAVGKVQILNVHLRPQISDSGSVVSGYFSTPSIREKEMVSYSGEMDDSLPTLVVGDFNEGSGGRALRVLELKGFTTALPQFAPSATTWRWNTSVGQVSAQLDHIAHDEQLTPIDAQVFADGRSDHQPIVATFVRN